MAHTHPLPLTPIADLTHFLEGGQVVAFNVGPEGHAYVVIAQKPLDYRETQRGGGASFAKIVPSQPQRYRILSFENTNDGSNGGGSGAAVLDVTIENAAFNVHHVQPLENRLLLICARSFYGGPNNAERNGHLFDTAARPLGSLLLGDGIQDVQATKTGVIWTSFFDEGIFGNYGWQEPVGESGLVASDSGGRQLYSFDPPPGLDNICDCYALNVESDEIVWCYYYTEFPLVRLCNFKVEKYWNMPLAGCDAFAVGGGYALFHGGYDEENQFSLFDLPHHREPALVRRFALDTKDTKKARPGRAAKREADRVVGRGASLWVLRGGSHLLTCSIYDALAA